MDEFLRRDGERVAQEFGPVDNTLLVLSLESGVAERGQAKWDCATKKNSCRFNKSDKRMSPKRSLSDVGSLCVYMSRVFTAGVGETPASIHGTAEVFRRWSRT